MIKRPYAGVAKKISINVKGVEAVFFLGFGFSACIWIMTGAFARSGNLNRQIYNFCGCFLVSTFLSDLSKVYAVHGNYEKDIKEIFLIYDLPNKNF